jgi:hypothetical protein
MYVYIKSEPGLWTVGFYSPDGKWHSESDHDSAEKAAARVRGKVNFPYIRKREEKNDIRTRKNKGV